MILRESHPGPSSPGLFWLARSMATGCGEAAAPAKWPAWARRSAGAGGRSCLIGRRLSRVMIDDPPPKITEPYRIPRGQISARFGRYADQRLSRRALPGCGGGAAAPPCRGCDCTPGAFWNLPVSVAHLGEADDMVSPWSGWPASQCLRAPVLPTIGIIRFSGCGLFSEFPAGSRAARSAPCDVCEPPGGRHRGLPPGRKSHASGGAQLCGGQGTLERGPAKAFLRQATNHWPGRPDRWHDPSSAHPAGCACSRECPRA
jgi:hypothetical protein